MNGSQANQRRFPYPECRFPLLRNHGFITQEYSADSVKIARYALDKWQNLKQYSVMDELRIQLKTMNRQFGFYMKPALP